MSVGAELSRYRCGGASALTGGILAALYLLGYLSMGALAPRGSV